MHPNQGRGPLSDWDSARTKLGWCANYVVHFGNLCALVAANQTDMLHLRALMMAATACGITFNLLQPRPLWVPAAWGFVFIFSHGYQIYTLLKERQHILLTPQEQEAYAKAFMPYNFTPRQFVDIMRKSSSRWCSFKRGEWIQKQGDASPEIHYVMQGEVVVTDTDDDDDGQHILLKVEPGRGGWLGK